MFRATLVEDPLEKTMVSWFLCIVIIWYGIFCYLSKSGQLS